MSFEWGWPWMALAVLLPLLSYRGLPPRLTTTAAPLRVPFMESFEALQMTSLGGEMGQQRRLQRLIGVVAWLALVVAAMRPQWVGEAQLYPVTGRDLLLAIDISGSMVTEDFQQKGRILDRLSATKLVAGEFIGRRNGDRIGLILFGTQPFVQAPLTFDRETVRTLLHEAVIGMAGEQTAIGDAIGLAVKRLQLSRQQGVEMRPVLILMTDGANTTGVVKPLEAAQLAHSLGLKIYTVGIGADTMQVRDLFGSRTVNPAADLDERTLRQLASATEGRYFRARDTEELQQIYQLLDELEPVSREDRSFRPQQELFHWPLLLALLLLVVTLLLRWQGGE